MSQGFHISEPGLGDVNFQQYFGHRRPLIPKTGVIFSALSDFYFEKYFIRKYDYDIYHSTYYKLLASKFRGKRVVTVYDMIHERFNNPFYEKDPTVVNKKNICYSADGIICISQSTKNDLIEYLDIDEEKINVIYLANSLNKSNDFKRLVNDPYILFVGHRSGYKNFDVLFKAYCSNRSIKENFYLVCFGGGNFSKTEQALFDGYNVSGRLKQFAGPDRILTNLYSYASAFIFPSFYEGFGLPVLEAMHLGCPVIISDRSSLPEVAGSAGLYFNPESAEDLSEKLEKVLSDTKLRESLIIKGYQQEKKFSWDICAKNTLDFYQTL